jgi:hypothetical protein
MKYGVKCVCEPWLKVDYWIPFPKDQPRFETADYIEAVIYKLGVEQSNPGCSFEIQEIEEGK